MQFVDDGRVFSGHLLCNFNLFKRLGLVFHSLCSNSQTVVGSDCLITGGGFQLVFEVVCGIRPSLVTVGLKNAKTRTNEKEVQRVFVISFAGHAGTVLSFAHTINGQRVRAQVSRCGARAFISAVIEVQAFKEVFHAFRIETGTD